MHLAEEFLRIFDGGKKAHGEFKIKKIEGAKAKGAAMTVPTPPSLDLWEQHLNGKIGIGIIPIRENNTCNWGAIDIDVYENLDLEELSTILPAPFVLCRSKSGGAHVYLFTNMPVSAKVLRKKLTLMARALGHPNAEIFPKQDNLEPGDVGNWINMPYFEANTTMRYCIKNGLALSAEDFVGFANENSISNTQLMDINPEIVTDVDMDSEFVDAPPCLKYFIKNGFPTGSRNSALFSMGVFARRKFPNSWEDKIFEYNKRFMSGSYSEVATIVRSLNKKDYKYKCKDQPLIGACQREDCATCAFGIPLTVVEDKSTRPNVLDDVVGVELHKPDKNSSDYPYWVFKFESDELVVTVDMTRSQVIFGREYIRQFYTVMQPIPDSKWVKSVNALINPSLNENLVMCDIAPDAGPEGQMLKHLEDFCTNKSSARTKSELLLGKPWHEDEKTFFRSADFLKYLDQQRFKGMKESDIFMVLKRRGADHVNFYIKGKHVTCWSVDSFKIQTEGFEREVMTDETSY